MYKVKRFSILDFGGRKFTPDMSDLDNIDKNKFVDGLIKTYPDLKFMRSVIKIQEKINGLNSLLDDYSIWKDCEVFTVPGFYFRELDADDFIKTTEDTRKGLNSNNYVTLIYDGYYFLNYSIPDRSLVLVSPWDKYKISKKFLNIGQYIKYCIELLESVFNDPFVREDFDELDSIEADSILSKYKSLLNSVR